MAIIFLGTLPAIAGYQVIGTVTDAKDNSPLVGVNITMKRNSGGREMAGAVTGTHGKFSVEDIEGECELELTYIGYETMRMSLVVNDDINLGTIQMHENATELGEVVVEGDAAIQKVDRKVLLPNKEQRAASSDGVTLLNNLQIPRIVVNMSDNSVTTLSNESVQLRINGIEASTADVVAINPKDVIRIEYHDQPGVRYKGAAAVIDYIVKHRDTGGSLMLDANNCVNMAEWGQYYVSGKLHFGKSSLSLVSGYAPRIVLWTRSNSETYHFSETGLTPTMVENTEQGEPTRFKSNPVMVGLTYNWTNGDKNMLNITLRDNMDFTPNERTDRDSRLMQHTDTFEVHDHESTRSHAPAIDIYFQQSMPRKQKIYLNAVGTYINSSTSRHFLQKPLGSTIGETTDVSSAVEGNKYSIIGEAIYEKEWDKITLTAGARHDYQWVENNYIVESAASPSESRVSMTTAETYAFAEAKQRFDKFSYIVGIGVMHTYIAQGGQKQSSWIARPQLTLSYDFGKGVFWKYKAYVSGYQPSLSQMSDVSQQMDKYQIRRGNPDLKPVMYFSNEMELTWQSKHVNLTLWANYSYDHKPIMDETHEEFVDGKPMAIRTYDNQRGFHRLKIAPSIQVRLLDNKLSFTVAPFANYYVSLGNGYTHKHFNPGVRASVMGMYKNWMFFASVNTRYNDLWGETLKHGEFGHAIGVGYNQEKWGFRAMLLEPFSTKGYNISTENLSALAPNTQHAAMKDFRQMFLLNFHCNLDFGVKRNEHGKRLNNEDTDSGILSGAK